MRYVKKLKEELLRELNTEPSYRVNIFVMNGNQVFSLTFRPKAWVETMYFRSPEKILITAKEQALSWIQSNLKKGGILFDNKEKTIFYPTHTILKITLISIPLEEREEVLQLSE